jgi:hypothetical protein
MKHIRIIGIPPGEAPERIRAAWVGVTLPLADIPGPQPGIRATAGVLGKDRSLWSRLKHLFGVPTVEQPAPVYVVDVIAAIESLRSQSPVAVEWWERHTPNLLKPGKRFCFDATCCVEIADDTG